MKSYVLLLFGGLVLSVKGSSLIRTMNKPICLGRLLCRDSFLCLDYDKVCDGFDDCPFADDETNCQCISDDDCISGSVCVRAGAHKKCSRNCRRGFKDIHGRCLDQDECREKIANCEANEVCVNTYGSYRCDCKYGYRRLDSKSKCVDINECEGEDQICESPLCVNTMGSFSCPCPEHFEPVHSYKDFRFMHSCTMKNYCHNVTCQAPFKCVTRSNGSSLTSCECSSGYKMIKTKSGNNTCEDVDECERSDLNICDRIVSRSGKNSYQCENRHGSYACRCNNVFRSLWLGDALISICPEIEIHCRNQAQCPEHSTCRENMCICNEGFRARNGTCDDIDECDLGIHNCPEDLRCLNTEPGFKCVCQEGFEIDEAKSTSKIVKCKDVDECKLGTNICIHGCTNTNGSYICTCPDGFFKVHNFCYPWNTPSSLLILDENNTLQLADFSFSSHKMVKREIHPYENSCKTRSPAEFIYSQKARTFYHVSTDRTCIYSNNKTMCRALLYDTEITHLRVDNEFGNLYWIGDNNTLHVADADAQHIRALYQFTTNISYMVVNSHQGWLLAISNTTVYKLDLDGRNPIKIKTYDNPVDEVYVDAEYHPLVRMNDSLHVCPDFENSYFEDCRKLSIKVDQRIIIDVFMDFVYMINPKGQLEISSTIGTQEFNFSDSNITSAARVILVQKYQRRNHSDLCLFCTDLCLNSPSQESRCACGDHPCDFIPITVQFFSGHHAFRLWHVVVACLLLVIIVSLFIFRTSLKHLIDRSKLPNNEHVGFYSENSQVRVNGSFTASPFVDIPYEANLIDD